MKNEGYVSLVSVMVALTVSILTLTSFQPLIINKANMNKTVENNIEKRVSSRDGLERLYSNYNYDISAEPIGEEILNVDFDDLDVQYEFKNQEILLTEINNQATSQGFNFYINNKTKLIVDLSFRDLRGFFDRNAYYSFDIIHNGKSILNQPLDNKSYSSTPITLEFDINNPEKYGEYEIICNTHNMDVFINIKYDEQSLRRIKVIESNGIERVIRIENNIRNRETNQYIEL